MPVPQDAIQTFLNLGLEPPVGSDRKEDTVWRALLAISEEIKNIKEELGDKVDKQWQY